MAELEEKTERLVRMLAENELDAVVLNAQHNFAWLTGGGSNGVDLSRENGVASLMIARDGRRTIFANNIEMPRMLAEQVSGSFDPVEFSWQNEKADGSIVLKHARQILRRDARIATDIPMFADTSVIEGKIAPCRYRLTTEEQERFRDLGRDAGVAMGNLVGKLEQGDMEVEIAEKLRHELGKAGILSVVTLVAADERISHFRHPLPTTKRWQKTVLAVTCAKRHGLIASMSRIITIGEPDGELKRKTEAAAYVNAALLNATRPGATGAGLYKVAADAYAAHGFAEDINHHHQGGAAGYKTRDWVAHPQNAEIVQPDQAFAWNPSITGTKVEDTTIVTADGIEIVTPSPLFPQIESIIDGRSYLSPGVLTF